MSIDINEQFNRRAQLAEEIDAMGEIILRIFVEMAEKQAAFEEADKAIKTAQEKLEALEVIKGS